MFEFLFLFHAHEVFLFFTFGVGAKHENRFLGQYYESRRTRAILSAFCMLTFAVKIVFKVVIYIISILNKYSAQRAIFSTQHAHVRRFAKRANPAPSARTLKVEPTDQ